MEPTVLAGPVEFSPAEIALIFAVLAGMFVALMAPGWVALGYAARARRKAQGDGPGWGSAVAGSIGGLILCGGVAALSGALLESLGSLGIALGVAASWAACWAIAYAISPRSTIGASDAGSPTSPTSPTSPSSDGWGR